jgi:glycerol-3-phosphate acyltransferase PlsX
MRIAVDVMGGDHGCGVVIAGAKKALQADEKITAIYIVGNKAEIHAALPEGGFRDHRVRVVHASEVITMDEEPASAVRRKRDASIVRAMELVRDQRADAVVSAGNTGGIFASASFKLKRIEGVRRGGIATVIPTAHQEFVLLDSGANIECKPIDLAQFAIMGSVYSREILGRSNPRVGVLSIGTEDNKGNELTLGAFELCKKLPINFVGNVEGYDLFENRVDVVICDGFVGNIVLKTCEGLATAMFSLLKQELKVSTRRKLGAMLAKYAFRSIKKRMDPDGFGGAPMLGFNGSVMKAHGSAREKAISIAIHVAACNIQNRVNDFIAREIANAKDVLLAAESSALPTPPA